MHKLTKNPLIKKKIEKEIEKVEEVIKDTVIEETPGNDIGKKDAGMDDSCRNDSGTNDEVRKEENKNDEDKNENGTRGARINEIIIGQLVKNELLKNGIDRQENDLMGMTGTDLLKTLLDKAVNNGTGIKENKELIRKANGQFMEMNGHIETLMLQSTIPHERDKKPITLGEAIAGLDGKVIKVADDLTKQTQGFAEINKQISGLMDKLGFPVRGVEDLKNALQQHAAMFREPYAKTVHHKHFLGKSFLILIGLSLLVLTVGFFWNKERERADQYLENDSKWRFLKLTRDPALLIKATAADSSYLANPEEFRKIIYAEEERRQALFEKQLQLEENEMEIRKLEKMEKKEKDKRTGQ